MFYSLILFMTDYIMSSNIFWNVTRCSLVEVVGFCQNTMHQRPRDSILLLKSYYAAMGKFESVVRIRGQLLFTPVVQHLDSCGKHK